MSEFRERIDYYVCSWPVASGLPLEVHKTGKVKCYSETAIKD